MSRPADYMCASRRLTMTELVVSIAVVGILAASALMLCDTFVMRPVLPAAHAADYRAQPIEQAVAPAAAAGSMVDDLDAAASAPAAGAKAPRRSPIRSLHKAL